MKKQYGAREEKKKGKEQCLRKKAKQFGAKSIERRKTRRRRRSRNKKKRVDIQRRQEKEIKLLQL